MALTKRDVVIVGGGFSGVATAIHLSRAARTPLRITIVEPHHSLGRGLAYGNPETQFRLNGPGSRHALYPELPSHFEDWYVSEALERQDPSARDASGLVFPRRYDFGSYLSAQTQGHMVSNPSGSHIEHVKERAEDADKTENGFTVILQSGKRLATRVLVVANTPDETAIPKPFACLPKDGASFLPDPWDTHRIRGIPEGAKILILGMAQTASDVASVLLVHGHAGGITLLSRRGIRPRRRPMPVSNMAAETPEEGYGLPESYFEPDGAPREASRILQSLRRNASAARKQGQSWVPVMEHLRDAIFDHWHALPDAIKSRFLRHCRPWYDAHRFRLPPQIEARIDAANDSGQLTFMAASVQKVVPRGKALDVHMRKRGHSEISVERFDVVINCTGLSSRVVETDDRFLTALLSKGLAIPHSTGHGFEVDDHARAIGKTAEPDAALFVVGPSTYGAFADQQGSVFIARRIVKNLPRMLAVLEGT